MREQRGVLASGLSRGFAVGLVIVMGFLLSTCLPGMQAASQDTTTPDVLSPYRLQELDTMLHSKDPGVVSYALEEVKKVKDKRLLPIILGIHPKYTSNEHVSEELEHLRETIQVQIIQSLVGFGDPSALSLLQQGFAGDNNEITRAYYAWALVEFQDRQGVDHLLSVMADKGEPDRTYAAAVVRPIAANLMTSLVKDGKLTPEDILAYVEKLELNLDYEYEAAMKSIEGGAKFDLDAHTERIKNTYGVPLLAAFQTLIKLGSRSVMPLVGSLSNPALKRSLLLIVGALAEIKDKRAIEPLMTTLENSDDENIKKEAANALQILTGMNYGTDIAAWKNWLKTQKTRVKSSSERARRST